VSQSNNRSRKTSAPPPRTNPALAWVSALIVVAVFVVLGFVLFGRGNGPETAAAPTLEPFAVETAAPVATADTSAPTPVAATDANNDVAARDGKYSAPPPMTIDPNKQYTATITTPRGDIQIKLRPDLAPEAVNNFVFLAREGFYDGTTWHRVLPNFMAQGGDPTGTGGGGPGYTIKDEYTPNTKFDRKGLVAMARTSAPNSAGSQFFITTAAAPWLDGQYTIFGEVTEGQDIVDNIPLRDPDQNPGAPGEQIVKIAINEA
jgi:peptidylprolyl isomerase